MIGLDFEVKVLILSFVATVLLGMLIIPVLRKLKIGQIEREDGPKTHLKKQGTPTMGGIIIILTVMLATAGIYLYGMKKGTQTSITVAKHILPLMLVTVGFGLIGLIDDFKKLVLKNTKGLKPAYKMLGLLAVSTIYVLFLVKGLGIGTEIFIPFAKIYLNLPVWIYVPFAIFVMLATTNAINLTDGIDGLSTSVTTIIITCLTVMGIILGIQEISLFGSIVVGACLGFLLFNLHPAKVFMGDTGSLLLGGVISAIALYLKNPLIILLIAFVPVMETLSVIIQVAYFKKTGNRIFKMAPIHHHFELSGWKENKVVVVFSLITLILCFIGLNAI